jgi:beta-glucanase (GH16 family)
LHRERFLNIFFLKVFNITNVRVSVYNILQPIFILLIVILAVTACKKSEVTDSDQSKDPYQLVWADEFDTNGPPDEANWHFEEGFVRNEELQWYQSENAYCTDGYLIIEAKREQKENPNYVPGSDSWKTNRAYAEYTSSSLLTRGLHSWLFGRFEMRAKIDARPGLWPAFWTLGVSGSWPHNGEVDIMEYYQSKLLANIAWGAEEKWQAVWDSYSFPVSTLIEHDPEWLDKFHLWRMDWDETSIKLYLDDTLLNTANLADTFNRDQEGKNPFLQPHYIIVNLAIGGTAGGDPSRTTFPAFYQIDYIRVYQK